MNLLFPRPQFMLSTGLPIASGTLETYAPGTSTPKVTYPTKADLQAATNANGTTLTLDSSGRPSVDLWLNGAYKMILKDADSNTVYTIDNINDLEKFRAADGSVVFEYTANSSAVNQITIANAATTNSPTISATGDDTNIDLTLAAKGTGTVTISSDLSLASGTLNLSTISPTTDTTVSVEDSRTSTVNRPFKVKATTSGTPAAGIGTGLVLIGESADETSSNLAAIDGIYTDVTGASEDSVLGVSLRVAGGALDEKYRLASTSTANKVTFTHAATSDRTITIPDKDLTLGVGSIVAESYNETTTSASGTTLIPFDTSIPQSGEGFQVMTGTITHVSTSNKVEVIFDAWGACTVDNDIAIALFQDSNTDATKVTVVPNDAENNTCHLYGHWIFTVPQTGSTTYKIRLGARLASTTTFLSGSVTFGGVAPGSLIIRELVPNS